MYKCLVYILKYLIYRMATFYAYGSLQDDIFLLLPVKYARSHAHVFDARWTTFAHRVHVQQWEQCTRSRAIIRNIESVHDDSVSGVVPQPVCDDNTGLLHFLRYQNYHNLSLWTDMVWFLVKLGPNRSCTLHYID